MKNIVSLLFFPLAIFIFQSKAYACVEAGRNSCILKSNYAYQSKFGSARVQGYGAYSSSPNARLRFNKMVIVVAGHDPSNTETPDDIRKQIDQVGGVQALRNKGYDVVIIKPTDSNTHLQRNALTLVTLIQNLSNISNNDIKILGISLGGVTAKYALSYMEYENIPHNVSKYISYDAPHEGAHIPPALQVLPIGLKRMADTVQRRSSFKLLKNFLPGNLEKNLKQASKSAALVSDRNIYSPLAKQLLRRHYIQMRYDEAESKFRGLLNKSGKPPCYLYNSYKKDRDNWKAQLNIIDQLKSNLSREMAKMGGFPSSVHSVAITNGNLTGKELSINPGQAYFSYKSRRVGGPLKVRTYFYAAAEKQGQALFSSKVRGRFSGKSKYYGRVKHWSAGSREFLDNAPGGYIDTPVQLAKIYNKFAAGTFGSASASTRVHTYVTTCSALAIKRSVDNCRFSSEAEAAKASPFDKVYSVTDSSGKSTPHADINDRVANIIFNELL